MLVSGNTVGSRENLKWNTNQVRLKRKYLTLSDVQRQVLIGLILGDGCLIRNKTDKNFRLQVEQSNRNREYVDWLYSIFQDWTLSPPRYVKQHDSWRFRTIVHPELTEIRRLFYRGNRKIIPIKIKGIFKFPLSLAVWFMDDGNGRKDARVYGISTHSFSIEENEILVHCLKDNFDIASKLHRDGHGDKYRLYIPASSSRKFEKLILPYILPSMKNKLPLTP